MENDMALLKETQDHSGTLLYMFPFACFVCIVAHTQK